MQSQAAFIGRVILASLAAMAFFFVIQLTPDMDKATDNAAQARDKVNAERNAKRTPAPKHVSLSMSRTNKIYAYNLGAACVKRLLRDPQSAQFASGMDKVRAVDDISEDVATVSSIVRARNGLGGMAVSRWTARVNVDTGSCTCSIK